MIGLVRPDGEIIKLVDKDEHYKYFCILEADWITQRNKIWHQEKLHPTHS